MLDIFPSLISRALSIPEPQVKATLDLLEKMRPYPNFVLSSGCDTPPHTPTGNIDAFFEALKEWND